MIYKIIGLLIGLLIFGAGIGPNFIYLSDDGVQFLIGHIQFVAIFRSPTPRTMEVGRLMWYPAEWPTGCYSRISPGYQPVFHASHTSVNKEVTNGNLV